MKTYRILATLAGLVLLAAAFAAPVSAQAQSEKWLHVRVNEGPEGETVRVNVPLSLAEAILPSIKVKHFEGGKVRLEEHMRAHIEDVDIRGILEAVKNSQDGEFVTVESKKDNVRVAKKAGYLLVEVREMDKDGKEREKVDVKMPMTVVDALLSGGKDELDILAAVRALAQHGDTELVTVQDNKTTVRVWVDSKNTSQ
ncbi:MAG: hypothetical protein ACRD5G_02285 [Candidatus Acidiferrales bacterium]